MKNSFHHHLSSFLLACLLPVTLTAATPPKVGDKAPDFTLNTMDHQSVRLSDLTPKGKTVLIVLRGWPGYQCPFCTQQVQDYVKSTSEFAGSHARVVMVYPGPADNLIAHAKEFFNNKDWPKDFTFVIDPAFNMVTGCPAGRCTGEEVADGGRSLASSSVCALSVVTRRI